MCSANSKYHWKFRIKEQRKQRKSGRENRTRGISALGVALDCVFAIFQLDFTQQQQQQQQNVDTIQQQIRRRWVKVLKNCDPLGVCLCVCEWECTYDCIYVCVCVCNGPHPPVFGQSPTTPLESLLAGEVAMTARRGVGGMRHVHGYKCFCCYCCLCGRCSHALIHRFFRELPCSITDITAQQQQQQQHKEQQQQAATLHPPPPTLHFVHRRRRRRRRRVAAGRKGGKAIFLLIFTQRARQTPLSCHPLPCPVPLVIHGLRYFSFRGSDATQRDLYLLSLLLLRFDVFMFSFAFSLPPPSLSRSLGCCQLLL